VVIANTNPTLGNLLASSAGVRVQLDLFASSASDVDGTVAFVRVVWGDGSPSETTPFTPPMTLVHDFRFPVEQSIDLVAIDNDGGESAVKNTRVASDIPQAGLISHLPLNGSVTQAVGPAFSASGTLIADTDRFGRGGQASALNNNGDSSSNVLVFIAGNQLVFQNSFTFSIWVKMDGTLSPSGDRFMGVGDWFAIHGNDGGPTGIRLGRTSGTRTADATPIALDPFLPGLVDGWVHYVSVVETIGSQHVLRIFRNGALQDAAIVTGPVPTRPACRVYVGTFDPNGNNCTTTTAGDGNGFRGSVDDARIYNRALSNVEVAALFNELRP